MSWPTALIKFRELIKFVTSLILGGSKYIEDFTLLRKKCANPLSFESKFSANFSPIVEKNSLNSFKIFCLSVILQLLTIICEGKLLLELDVVGGINERRNSHVLRELDLFFSSSSAKYFFLALVLIFVN